MLVNSAWKGAIFQLKHAHWRSSPRYSGTTCGHCGGSWLRLEGHSVRPILPPPGGWSSCRFVAERNQLVVRMSVHSTHRNRIQTNDKHAQNTGVEESPLGQNVPALREMTLRFTCHFSFLCKHSQISSTQHFPQRSHRQKDFAAKLLSIIRHPLTTPVF